MAGMTMSDAGLQLLLDWEHAEGVTSDALAATWCRLEIRVADRIVTAVEDRRTSSMRRAVYTSAYPLAEWIAENWWLLRTHVRPSAVPRESWTWPRVTQQPWLRSHNMRAAGNGMPWPDLTIVPEGAVTSLVWTAGVGLAEQPVAFLTSGDAYLAADGVTDALARFVDQVLVRLAVAGVSDTVLQQEWQLLADGDAEADDFAAAVARLGSDPFDVPDALADDVLALAEELDPAVLAEFLDSARPTEIRRALHWLQRARTDVVTRSRPSMPMSADGQHSGSASQLQGTPWAKGYTMARAYREQLALGPRDGLPAGDLVATTSLDAPAGGLQGLVAVVERTDVGLVLPAELRLGPASVRFAQARALALSLLSDRELLLLDPAHTDLSKTARAFAAEVLAPAEGIRDYLAVLPEVTTSAFEAVAGYYEVSPLLVQHQYDNQIARTEN